MMTRQSTQIVMRWRWTAVAVLLSTTLGVALSAPERDDPAPKAPSVTLNTEIEHWGFYPSFSPDGKTIACIAALHQVNLWDSRTGELKQILSAPDCNTIIQTIT